MVSTLPHLWQWRLVGQTCAPNHAVATSSSGKISANSIRLIPSRCAFLGPFCAISNPLETLLKPLRYRIYGAAFCTVTYIITIAIGPYGPTCCSLSGPPQYKRGRSGPPIQSMA